MRVILVPGGPFGRQNRHRALYDFVLGLLQPPVCLRIPVLMPPQSLVHFPHLTAPHLHGAFLHLRLNLLVLVHDLPPVCRRVPVL